jgi:hypothetical protein
MASAPRTDPDVRQSLAEKGEKPKSPVVAPVLVTRPPSPVEPEKVAIPVQPSGVDLLKKAIGPGYFRTAGKKKTRKQKKRAQKKTQKRRGRK